MNFQLILYFCYNLAEFALKKYKNCKVIVLVETQLNLWRNKIKINFTR